MRFETSDFCVIVSTLEKCIFSGCGGEGAQCRRLESGRREAYMKDEEKVKNSMWKKDINDKLVLNLERPKLYHAGSV